MTSEEQGPGDCVFVACRFANYTRILDKLRAEYEANNQPDYLVVPYVVVCAAALEAMLNDELFDKAHETWGTNSEPFWKAFRSMSFPDKLRSSVTIVTDGAFRMNTNHRTYQLLRFLIKERNRLVHPGPTEHTIDFEDENEAIGLLGVPRLPKQFVKGTIEDITIGARRANSPQAYHDAVLELSDEVFSQLPDDLESSDLVVRGELSN